jgi:hypothetical protein
MTATANNMIVRLIGLFYASDQFFLQFFCNLAGSRPLLLDRPFEMQFASRSLSVAQVHRRIVNLFENLKLSAKRQ